MREGKRTRKGVDIATFSAKLNELMSIYNGMTQANKKKAAAILSSSLKTIVAPLDSSKNDDDTPHAIAPNVPSFSVHGAKEEKQGKKLTNPSYHNPGELHGIEPASLVQKMVEKVAPTEDSVPTYPKQKTRNTRLRKPRRNAAVAKSVQPRACTVSKRKKKTVELESVENGATVAALDTSSLVGANNEGRSGETDEANMTRPNCEMKEVSLSDTNLLVPAADSVESLVHGEVTIKDTKWNEKMGQISSIPLNEQYAPVDKSHRLDALVQGSVGSSVDRMLEGITAGEGANDGVRVLGSEGTHVVLGNGAQGDEIKNYDDDQCDDLLDLELDIYSESNYDAETEAESGQNKDVEVALKEKTRTQNVHRCQECNETFPHGRGLKRHLLEQHTLGDSQYPLSCRKCMMEFEAYILFKHHKCRLPTKGLTCKACGMKCANEERLSRHVRLKHSEDKTIPQHFCEFCSKGFRRKLSLYKHLNEHADGKFVCLRCGEFIDDKELYYEHIAKHDRDAEYMCEKCGIGFSKMQLYKKHMKAHEKFECPECNMTFPSRKAQFRHNRLIHAAQFADYGKRRYKCDVCPKSFSRPGMLDLHKRVHTGERPLDCDLCKAFFRTPKALRKHKMTNTHLLKAGEVARERNHLCALCGQAYFRKYALQRHMKTHCDDKPFSCPHCDYRCKESTNLKRHIMRHLSERNFICEICGSSFHTKKTLETHVIYKHSNDRDYKCTDCTMAFKTPNALRRHMTSHSDKRPHTCWCGSGFNRMYNLRRHMKSVHGTDEELPPVRKVRVLEEEVRGVYNSGDAPMTMPMVTSASEMPLFSPQENVPPSIINMSRAPMPSMKPDYMNSVCSQGIQPSQNPSLFTLTAPSLSLSDLKSAQLPPDMNYTIIQQHHLSEDEKVARVTSHLLSELRESVKHVEMSSMPPSNPASVQTSVPTPASTPASAKDGHQVETLASVGMETVLQDIVHRPTINTYDNHLYISQPTSAPVERKTPFISNMPQNYVHDFTNFNAASLYGAQFYTDPQRQRMMQLPEGLAPDQLQAVANSLPADLNKYHQPGAE